LEGRVPAPRAVAGAHRFAAPDQGHLRSPRALEPAQDLPPRVAPGLLKLATTIRVIGIDPGTRHLGWGVLTRTGTRIEHVAHGVIDTDLDGSLADRLVEIDTELEAVILAHAPDVGAVESIFFSKNANSAAK